MTKQVTVIIPIWNSGFWLPGCLQRLHQQTFTDFEILLVDNGSTDNSRRFIQTYFPDIEVIRLAQNMGFAAAVNRGIRHAKSEYIALLNVDTLPEPTWLATLVKRLSQSPPNVGSVASKMLLMQNPDLIDTAGDTLSWYGSAKKRGHLASAKNYQEVEFIFSACAGAALYRRKLFDRIGLFDETYHSYFEDIDLGLRAQLAGFQSVYEPQAKVLHYGHSAGVVGGFYVQLITRNRLLTMLKNIPGPLLLKYTPYLLFGQIYFFLVYKKPLDSLKGYGLFLQQLPHLFKKRQQILQHPTRPLEGVLSTELGEPSLWHIIRHKFK